MQRTAYLLTFVTLLLISSSASAEPVFRYEGATPLGGGMYAHDYVLDNNLGAVPIYDVETDIVYYHGWAAVHTPTDWYYYPGPMSRFVTDTAPCNVGYEQDGYRIEAATPTVQSGSVYFTDVSHQVVWQSSTDWPVPEPGTLVLLGLGACLPLLRRRK